VTVETKSRRQLLAEKYPLTDISKLDPQPWYYRTVGNRFHSLTTSDQGICVWAPRAGYAQGRGSYPNNATSGYNMRSGNGNLQ
jgi:hypothetical protein